MGALASSRAIACSVATRTLQVGRLLALETGGSDELLVHHLSNKKYAQANVNSLYFQFDSTHIPQISVVPASSTLLTVSTLT